MSNIRFGLTLSMYPPRDLVRTGVLGEKIGFDSLWAMDHLCDLPPSGDRVEPWTLLSSIGIRTRRVMLSTGVSDTQRRHPALTAHIVATLDELTNGRAAIGIGAGEAMNILPYGLPWEEREGRARRLREAVQCIKLLWASSRENPVNFSGNYYTLKEAWLDQHPVKKPNPPIYVGSLGSSRLLKIVGELADGWFPWFNTVETFRRRSEMIRDAAIAAGRRFEDIDRVALLFTATTEDKKLQKRAIDALRAEVLVLNDRKVLKQLGYEVPLATGTEYKYQRVLATQDAANVAAKAATAMPDDAVGEFMLIGNADDCIEKIDAFLKQGCRHIAIRDVIGQYVYGKPEKTEETLKFFGRKIIPYFKGKTKKKRKK